MAQRRDKILREIQLADKCRDFSWFENQFKRGRLRTSGGTAYTKKLFNEFRLAVKCVNEIYEGHWDVKIEVDIDDGKILFPVESLVIYFPEVNISNSSGREHTIKDLFIEVDFGYNSDKRRLKISGIAGGRMTQSYAEWSSDYMHSHLSTRKIKTSTLAEAPFYQEFCTGSGNINIYSADLNMEGFSEERLLRYFMQISTLVSWESLEGTPYRYMKNISVKSSGLRHAPGRRNRPSEAEAYALYDLTIEKYKHNKKIPELGFIFTGLHYEVQDNKKLDDFLLFAVDNERTRRDHLCYYEVTTGIHYNYEVEEETAVAPNIKKFYIFQGVEIKFHIEANPEQIKVERDYIIHPDKKEYIKKILKYEINCKAIRQGTINRYKN